MARRMVSALVSSPLVSATSNSSNRFSKVEADRSIMVRGIKGKVAFKQPVGKKANRQHGRPHEQQPT